MAAISSKGMPGYTWAHMPLASAVTYSVVSIAITLFNKAVLTSFGFGSTMTLTLLQGFVTVVCLEAMRWRGYIEYSPFSWNLVVKVGRGRACQRRGSAHLWRRTGGGRGTEAVWRCAMR